MDVSQAIRMKRAVRTFLPKSLTQEEISIILQAGRRAQSAKNRQPWHFIAIKDKDVLQDLSECGTYAGHLAGAALGIAILTPDPAQRWSILFDAGQAAAYMQLAAWELGIGSCLATIYELEKARTILEYPNDQHLHVAISFGYPADPEDLTRDPVSGGRRDAVELNHFDRWKADGIE